MLYHIRTHKKRGNRPLNMLDILHPLVLSAQVKCATKCSGEHTSWAVEHKLSYWFNVYVLHCSAGTCTSIRANLIVGLMWKPPQGCRTQLYQLFQSIDNCALKHENSTHLNQIHWSCRYRHRMLKFCRTRFYQLFGCLPSCRTILREYLCLFG